MDRDDIDRYLAGFANDPAATMDRQPEKRSPEGGIIGEALTAWDDDAIASGDFVIQRDEVRAAIYDVDESGGTLSVDDIASGKAPIAKNDRAQDLCDDFKYDNPADMEAAGLTKAELPEHPWSDDYWGIYLGMLGHRYGDEGFPESDKWKENYDYVQKNPAAKLIAAKDRDAIDSLSPSEKYDLLVGDDHGTLTKAMWAEGKSRYDASGSVETWMGICHGWSPASYNLPRPRKSVTVVSPSGIQVRFFPSDLKALGSLLWANAPPPARFIGTRCNEKDPKKDENGRVLSASAFDTNPGTWHLAMVNQIGVAKRAMVMDATYDYEVWNQPLFGYEYQYFNPQTMQFAANLREATVARDAFTRDRFSKYRSGDYKAVAGIAMRTRYMSEVAPTQAGTDDPANDSITVVDYYYDLELDDGGRILGGEWYLNKHPDFLWGPKRGTRAVTPAESAAEGLWTNGQAVPLAWRKAALRASASGLPLAKIVEHLLALAKG